MSAKTEESKTGNPKPAKASARGGVKASTATALEFKASAAKATVVGKPRAVRLHIPNGESVVLDFTKEGRLVMPEGLKSVDLVKKGIPYQAVLIYASHMGITEAKVLDTIGVSGGTVSRRRREDVLKPEESDRFYRLARVTEMAERVLEDPIKARAWLQGANRALGGVTPFSLLDTEPGVELVENTLNRIENGVYG